MSFVLCNRESNRMNVTIFLFDMPILVDTKFCETNLARAASW